MAKVLIAEALAPSCVDVLQAAGHTIITRVGLEPAELLEAVADVDALIIRSATQVTDEVLAAGGSLVVVGRAGIGLDNVDVEAATTRGVLVANAPLSNVVSAAEQAITLMLASARNVAQAHGALVEGRWERSRWTGVELFHKTIGLVGLGRVGRLVATRLSAFDTRLVAYDPYVSVENAAEIGVELLELDELMSTADFVTVHLPKTPETTGLIGADQLRLAKPTMRIVNTARGGIVDEVALYEALVSQQIAGAGLDVFDEEPCTDSPLFGLDNVVVTPHLGASTAEAQDRAGETIAEQVNLALAGEFVPFAVNVAASAGSDEMMPFLRLAERLGAFIAKLSTPMSATLEISLVGDLAGADTRVAELTVVKGFLGEWHDGKVTFVNAPSLADAAGLEITVVNDTATRQYRNLIGVRTDHHSLAGTLVGLHNEPRIVMLDNHVVEVPAADHVLVIRNEDRPGRMGQVGRHLGDAKINVSYMGLGRAVDESGALMVLVLDEAPSAAVLDGLRSVQGLLSVELVSF
ncbi:MAG: phosphoglycerate dehydrogenase [Actinobacteria bacterium]|nr:phosphoglycerate dehydrogenase [Actinomycetota bacterium]